jgi:NhaA family Na+:H+ antiporter
MKLINNYSLLLILGSLSAVIWANVAPESYKHLIHAPISELVWGGGGSHGHHPSHDAPAVSPHPDDGATGTDHAAPPVEESGSHGRTFNLEFLVNDILMALFFGIAAKEVWEALLPGGSLSDPKRAATPLMATAGGIFGPALVYIAGTYLTGTNETLGRGWAVPCATDIAFSFLVARIIFGSKHPAITFLLLLAIADDAAGLIILAIFYPRGDMHAEWLLLTFAAVVIALALQRNGYHSFWWYLMLPGVMSWVSFYQAGIHPALGLVPVIGAFPHAQTDLGIFAKEELKRHDTLSEFEHFWKLPVEIILGVFGLVNAGVQFGSVGTGTALVVIALLFGKPLGITLMTLFAEYGLKLERPAGVSYRHVITLGFVAGIGFTVALFVSTAAFPLTRVSQETLDAVKMGALLSFGAVPLSLIVAKLLQIKPMRDEDVPPEQSGPEVMI